MSILLHQEIVEKSKKKWYRKERIHIEPFKESHVGPNSYDVRLGNTLKIYDFEKIANLDTKRMNPTITLEIPAAGVILKPGVLYLGSTMEAIGSDDFVPMYEGRSSMARLGIQSHISAGFGDVGFKSHWTLGKTVSLVSRVSRCNSKFISTRNSSHSSNQSLRRNSYWTSIFSSC